MNRRLALAGVAVAGVVAGAGVAVWRLRVQDVELPADFWSLRFERPEGGELATSALKGRPALINFWATWCAPCLKELPLLDRFQREQGTAGCQVIGLAVDGPTPVREFLLKRPLAFPVGLAGLNGVDLARSLGNTAGGLPFSILLDRTGKVRHRKLGALGEDELTRWSAVS